MRTLSLAIAAIAPCVLLLPLSVESARAQANGSSVRSSTQTIAGNSPADPWQLDDYQRALMTGTTVPMDNPLSIEPTGDGVSVEAPLSSPPIATPGTAVVSPSPAPGLPQASPTAGTIPTPAQPVSPGQTAQGVTPPAASTPSLPVDPTIGVPLERDITEPPLVVAKAPAPEENKWFVSIYGGRVTLASLLGALTFDNSDGLADSYLVSLEAGREITRIWGNSLSLDVTGQVMKHFGDQDHFEFTGALALRWNDFPWNSLIHTTIAVGEGLSYATEIPALEALRRENTSQLLNFLLFEITFSLPNNPNWLLVGRINHRSGVFGLFNGVIEGSNNYAIGVRHKF